MEINSLSWILKLLSNVSQSQWYFIIISNLPCWYKQVRNVWVEAWKCRSSVCHALKPKLESKTKIRVEYDTKNLSAEILDQNIFWGRHFWTKCNINMKHYWKLGTDEEGMRYSHSVTCKYSWTGSLKLCSNISLSQWFFFVISSPAGPPLKKYKSGLKRL